MGKYFGTDGFRGEANVNLTAEHAFKVGRFLDLDSERALHATCEKFIRRFRRVEAMADKPVDQMDLPALEALWRQAKTEE